MNIVDEFLNGLIQAYKIYGLETKVGIKIRQIVDQHITKKLIEETSPKDTIKLVNDAIIDYYRKKQLESLK